MDCPMPRRRGEIPRLVDVPVQQLVLGAAEQQHVLVTFEAAGGHHVDEAVTAAFPGKHPAMAAEFPPFPPGLGSTVGPGLAVVVGVLDLGPPRVRQAANHEDVQVDPAADHDRVGREHRAELRVVVRVVPQLFRGIAPRPRGEIAPPSSRSWVWL